MEIVGERHDVTAGNLVVLPAEFRTVIGMRPTPPRGIWRSWYPLPPGSWSRGLSPSVWESLSIVVASARRPLPVVVTEKWASARGCDQFAIGVHQLAARVAPKALIFGDRVLSIERWPGKWWS